MKAKEILEKFKTKLPLYNCNTIFSICFCRSAENRKEEGNQLYKAKKYLEALAKYSAAIELCPENPAFYGNRSACHMMLSQYNKVNLFSNFSCMFLNPNNFSSLNSNCSKLLDMRNLQEQLKQYSVPKNCFDLSLFE